MLKERTNHTSSCARKEGKRKICILKKRQRGREAHEKGYVPVGRHLSLVLKDNSLQHASLISEQITGKGQYTERARRSISTLQL